MIDIYIYNRIASDESIPLLSYLYVYITSIIFYKKNKTMRMIFLYLDFNVFKKRHMNGFFVYFSSSVICSCYYCCFSNPNFLLLLFLAVIKKECTLKNSSRKKKKFQFTSSSISFFSLFARRLMIVCVHTQT